MPCFRLRTIVWRSKRALRSTTKPSVSTPSEFRSSDGLAAFQRPLTILVTDMNKFAPADRSSDSARPRAIGVRHVGRYRGPRRTATRWQTLRFAITGGNAGGACAMVPAVTGEVVVVDGGQLDYETRPTYTLTVTATDNGQPARTGTGTVTVMVDDVNGAADLSDRAGTRGR